MTHSELFDRYPTPGFPTPPCAGPLDLLWTRSDPAFGPQPPAEHRVVKFLCLGCGTHLVLDATAGLILNAYQPPPVKQAARELAGSPEG